MSVATIAQDGEFSAFAGCDRILMPLDGDVHLAVDGTRHDVSTFATVHFRGEESVEAVDVKRPTKDLNVIVSRAWGGAQLRIGAAPGSRLAPGLGQTVLVVALSEEVVTDAGGLSYLDAARLETGDELVITQGLVAEIWLAESIPVEEERSARSGGARR